MSARDLRRFGTALVLALVAALPTTSGAQPPAIADAELERAARAAPRITEGDIDAARRRFPMPSEAELSRVPIPAAPRLDALPPPAAAPPHDLEAIARGYRAIDSTGAVTALPSAEPALLVFVSFSLPQPTLAHLVEQAAAAGATLVLRGLVNNSLTQTVAQAQQLIGARQVGVQIDPLAFDRFGVTRAPSFVLLKRGAQAQPCAAGSCFAADAFAMTAGDVSLRYALEFISRAAPSFAGEAAPYLQRVKE